MAGNILQPRNFYSIGRLIPISILALCCVILMPLGASADWGWGDDDEKEQPEKKQDAEYVPVETRPSQPPRTPDTDEQGNPVNYGMYFGAGDEFVQSNVGYDRTIFITDEVVNALEGIGSTARSQSASIIPELPEGSESDNVYGAMFGVPDDAVGLEGYSGDRGETGNDSESDEDEESSGNDDED